MEKLTDTAANYRLRKAEQQKRLDEFKSTGDPGSLTNELALIRLLTEEAANNGQMHLASCLLTTLSRLAKTHDRQQMERGDLLAKVVVLQLATRIVNIVSRQFNTVPGWEAKMDAALIEISNEIDSAENPPELIPKS